MCGVSCWSFWKSVVVMWRRMSDEPFRLRRMKRRRRTMKILQQVMPNGMVSLRGVDVSESLMKCRWQQWEGWCARMMRSEEWEGGL